MMNYFVDITTSSSFDNKLVFILTGILSNLKHQFHLKLARQGQIVVMHYESLDIVSEANE